MFNWLQAITKVMALINVIQNDPQLLAAIMDLAALFKHPANGQPTMMAAANVDLEKQEPQKLSALKLAFNKNADVHSELSEGSNGHKMATDLGGLFNLFITLLPQIIALINSLKKPAST